MQILSEKEDLKVKVIAVNEKKILLVNCSPVRNGATAEIVKVIASGLSASGDVKSICIDDYDINYCKGCRVCHKTAKCVQSDDTEKLVGEFERADIIICVSPSYWADIPGQFKVFIDRCTPWCNTHEPQPLSAAGKRDTPSLCARVRVCGNVRG